MSANRYSAELDGLYPFLNEVAQMRRRARRHIERAAAAPAGLSAEHPTVLQLLNEALATELMCVSRYRNHSKLAGGALAESVRGEFLKYAREEELSPALPAPAPQTDDADRLSAQLVVERFRKEKLPAKWERVFNGIPGQDSQVHRLWRGFCVHSG